MYDNDKAENIESASPASFPINTWQEFFMVPTMDEKLHDREAKYEVILIIINGDSTEHSLLFGWTNLNDLDQPITK